MDNIEKAEEVMQVDIRNQVRKILYRFITQKQNHGVIEVALEGLAEMWMQDPSVILEEKSIFSSVFEIINTSKSMSDDTMALILKTYTNLLRSLAGKDIENDIFDHLKASLIPYLSLKSSR